MKKINRPPPETERERELEAENEEYQLEIKLFEEFELPVFTAEITEAAQKQFKGATENDVMQALMFINQHGTNSFLGFSPRGLTPVEIAAKLYDRLTHGGSTAEYIAQQLFWNFRYVAESDNPNKYARVYPTRLAE